MIGGSCTILPCDIRGWHSIAMPKRKALFAYGKTFNDGISSVFQFFCHIRFLLLGVLYSKRAHDLSRASVIS